MQQGIKKISQHINWNQVVAVVLSFINLVFSVVSFMVITEYVEMIIRGTHWRLAYHDVWVDSLFMLYGILATGYSVFTIIKYLRHRQITLLYPVLLFLFPFVVFIVVPYLLSVVRKIF